MITHGDLIETKGLIFDDLDCYFDELEDFLHESGFVDATIDIVYELINKRFVELEEKLGLNLEDNKKGLTVEVLK